MPSVDRTRKTVFRWCLSTACAWLLIVAWEAGAQTTNTPPASAGDDSAPQSWNLHFQNTDIVQGHPGYSAGYSGQNSLKSRAELQNTESLDLYGGVRFWTGAEFHVDALMWQGFG